jgi:hypothetical protein
MRDGFPIPTDWDEASYQSYEVIWPDSPQWSALLRGGLSGFALADVWDPENGDVDEAAAIGTSLIGLNTLGTRFPKLLEVEGALFSGQWDKGTDSTLVFTASLTPQTIFEQIVTSPAIATTHYTAWQCHISAYAAAAAATWLQVYMELLKPDASLAAGVSFGSVFLPDTTAKSWHFSGAMRTAIATVSGDWRLRVRAQLPLGATTLTVYCPASTNKPLGNCRIIASSYLA